MTTTASPTYRKTKAGEWVVFASKAQLDNCGMEIEVTTKAGKVKVESIGRIGRGFAVNGVEMAYGYITTARSASAFSSQYRIPLPRKYRARECDDCGEYATPGTSCWETGLDH